GLGVLAARRPGGWLDRCVSSVAYTLEAAPAFWLGLLAIWFFALKLDVLPAGGLTDAASDVVTFGQVASHLVLPAAVLG
ncbi:ABC transporter permease, partial [Streptomyces sp. BF-3]